MMVRIISIKRTNVEKSKTTVEVSKIYRPTGR